MDSSGARDSLRRYVSHAGHRSSAYSASLLCRFLSPAPLINLLNREIVKVLKRPEIGEKFFSASTEVIASGPAELVATMKSEMARMGKVIKAAGIRVE